MESKRRSSSILKPPKAREPLADLNQLLPHDGLDTTPPTETCRRSTRVGFTSVKIKEFESDDKSIVVSVAPVFEKRISTPSDLSSNARLSMSSSADRSDLCQYTNIYKADDMRISSRISINCSMDADDGQRKLYNFIDVTESNRLHEVYEANEHFSQQLHSPAELQETNNMDCDMSFTQIEPLSIPNSLYISTNDGNNSVNRKDQVENADEVINEKNRKNRRRTICSFSNMSLTEIIEPHIEYTEHSYITNRSSVNLDTTSSFLNENFEDSNCYQISDNVASKNLHKSMNATNCCNDEMQMTEVIDNMNGSSTCKMQLTAVIDAAIDSQPAFSLKTNLPDMEITFNETEQSNNSLIEQPSVNHECKQHQSIISNDMHLTEIISGNIVSEVNENKRPDDVPSDDISVSSVESCSNMSLTSSLKSEDYHHLVDNIDFDITTTGVNTDDVNSLTDIKENIRVIAVPKIDDASLDVPSELLSDNNIENISNICLVGDSSLSSLNSDEQPTPDSLRIMNRVSEKILSGFTNDVHNLSINNNNDDTMKREKFPRRSILLTTNNENTAEKESPIIKKKKMHHSPVTSTNAESTPSRLIEKFDRIDSSESLNKNKYTEQRSMINDDFFNLNPLSEMMDVSNLNEDDISKFQAKIKKECANAKLKWFINQMKSGCWVFSCPEKTMEVEIIYETNKEKLGTVKAVNFRILFEEMDFRRTIMNTLIRKYSKEKVTKFCSRLDDVPNFLNKLSSDIDFAKNVIKDFLNFHCAHYIKYTKEGFLFDVVSIKKRLLVEIYVKLKDLNGIQPSDVTVKTPIGKIRYPYKIAALCVGNDDYNYGSKFIENVETYIRNTDEL